MSAVRIYRYILREVSIPGALAVFIFTLVLLMGRMLRLVEMVINKGVAFTEILLLFLYLLPAFLVITLPLSFLLGVLLGFGRLSADGEVIALKSAGVSLYGLLRPVLLLSVLVCAATAFLTLWAEPRGNAAFRSQVFQIAAGRASVGIQPRVFNSEFDGLMLYTEEMDERQNVMRGIFISDDRMDTPSTITASRGRLLTSPQNLTLTLRLEDGAIHRRPPQDDDYQTIRFATYDIHLNMGQRLDDSRPRKMKEIGLADLLSERREADTLLRSSTLTAEIHRRFIFPLAPLLFALVGVPLGIQNQRSGRGGGFAVGLSVFLIYYMLQSFAATMAVEGGLPTVPVLWLPTFAFLAGGIYLIRLSAQERRLVLLDRLLEGASEVWRRMKRRRPSR